MAAQSNWGGDQYRSLFNFFFFFENCGIFHCVSCPHIHQQNEAIERKHRHLVKTSLALLYYACVPLHCWGFVFLQRKVYNEYNFN